MPDGSNYNKVLDELEVKYGIKEPPTEFDTFEDDDQSCDCPTTWPDVAIVFIQAAFFLILLWICAGTPGWGK